MKKELEEIVAYARITEYYYWRKEINSNKGQNIFTNEQLQKFDKDFLSHLNALNQKVQCFLDKYDKQKVDYSTNVSLYQLLKDNNVEIKCSPILYVVKGLRDDNDYGIYSSFDRAVFRLEELGKQYDEESFTFKRISNDTLEIYDHDNYVDGFTVVEQYLDNAS